MTLLIDYTENLLELLTSQSRPFLLLSLMSVVGFVWKVLLRWIQNSKKNPYELGTKLKVLLSLIPLRNILYSLY